VSLGWFDPGSGTGREELQGDVVRVAEGQGEADGVLGDAAVGDPELVQTVLPLLELASVGAPEADVIQPGTNSSKRWFRSVAGCATSPSTKPPGSAKTTLRNSWWWSGTAGTSSSRTGAAFSNS
jgi:hypothetical protein